MTKEDKSEIVADVDSWEAAIEEIDAKKPWLAVGETVQILPSAPEKIVEKMKGENGRPDWEKVSRVFAILQKDGSVSYRRVNEKLFRDIGGKMRQAEYPVEGIRYTRNQ